MNNWTCSKCNSSNAEGQRFCGSCGQPRQNESQASSPAAPAELPPTIMGGYVPQPPAPPLNQPPPTPASPNQQSSQNQYREQNQANYQSQSQNQYQSQQSQNNYQQSQNQYQPQPPHQQVQAPSAPAAGKKSTGKILAVAGGGVGLGLLLIVGIVLYFAAIKPYLAEQAFIKKEKENQSKADFVSPAALLPTQFTSYESGSPVYNRVKTYNKMEMLQASQNLPPELKDGINDVTDAGAGEYLNSNTGNLKVVLQIFKFNSPDKAGAKCAQIGQEMQKRPQLFKQITVNPPKVYDSKRPSLCYSVSEGKNGEGIIAHSAYGILYVASGGRIDATRAAYVDASSAATR